MHETIFCGRAVQVVNLGDVGRGILSCVQFFKFAGLQKGQIQTPGSFKFIRVKWGSF